MKHIGGKNTEFRKIGIRSPALIIGVLLMSNFWVLNLPLLWEFKLGFLAFKMKTIYFKKKMSKSLPQAAVLILDAQNFRVKELIDAYVSSKGKIQFSSLLRLNKHWGKWLQPFLETSLTKGQKRDANIKWKVGKLKHKAGERLKVT